MRIARDIVNSFFSRTSERLSALSPSEAIDAIRIFRPFAALAGRPLVERMDPRVLTGTIEIITDALLRTPYGRPLEFEYPLIISVSASSYCPFACSNCYSNAGVTAARGEARNRLQIFAKVAASKTPFVIVSGGEPVVTEGIEDCLKLLLDSGKFVFLSTNALVERHLDLARQYDDRLRFVLPVWGDRERHNARRGANSFERIEQNIAVLNAASLKPHIHVVLSDTDFSVFQDVERLARSNAIEAITIGRRIDVGRLETPPIEFSEDYWRRLRIWQKKLRRHVRLVVRDLPEMRGPKGSGFMQRMLGLPAPEGCSAGNWMMHIDDAGHGYPCFSFEGQRNQSVAAELPIVDQWKKIRGLRARFPVGALCVAERKMRYEGVST
jgi:MoaA/NifB/PqqE/SkfB family radical SAM enzyme